MITFRSNCPLSRALDIIGDKWTLLVLREMIAFSKTTFKEFVQMPEHIASNILSDRLQKLVEEGLIVRKQSLTNKRIFHYHPTQKAHSLLPAVMLIRQWSEKYLFSPGEVPSPIGLA